jgi:hypothetical protein
VVPSAVIAGGAPFFHGYRDNTNSDGYISAGFSGNIDPGFWDDGSGTLQAVANNDYTVQPVFIFPSLNFLFVGYGQQVFNQKTDAVEAIQNGSVIWEERTQLNTACFLGNLVVKGNATDLTDSAQAELFVAPSLRESIRGISSGATAPATIVNFLNIVGNARDNTSINSELNALNSIYVASSSVNQTVNGNTIMTFGSEDITDTSLVTKSGQEFTLKRSGRWLIMANINGRGDPVVFAVEAGAENWLERADGGAFGIVNRSFSGQNWNRGATAPADTARQINNHCGLQITDAVADVTKFRCIGNDPTSVNWVAQSGRVSITFIYLGE